jgi:hypothetical protein
MDAHENAKTTPHSRMLMIERLRQGWTVAAVAATFGKGQVASRLPGQRATLLQPDFVLSQ